MIWCPWAKGAKVGLAPCKPYFAPGETSQNRALHRAGHRRDFRKKEDDGEGEKKKEEKGEEKRTPDRGITKLQLTACKSLKGIVW